MASVSYQPTAADQTNRIIAIGFGVFAALYAFTFLLLVLVTVGVFAGLGVTMTRETGDNTNAGIAVLGSVLTIVFYAVLALIFVLPPALACWKMLKRRPAGRRWGIVAALSVAPILPLGTALTVFSLKFLIGAEGRLFYQNLAIISNDTLLL